MLGNWTAATTTTTGTGSLTLSAVSGRPSPASQFSTGERFSYVLKGADGAPIEGGIGYLDSGGLLVREVPMSSYVSGTYADATAAAGVSPVSLSGTTTVILTPLKQSIVPAARRGRASGTQNNDIFYPYPTSLSFYAAAVTANVTNRSHYYAALCDFAFPVDALTIYLGATSGNLDLGIYSCKADGSPGDLLLGWPDAATTASALNVFTFGSATVGQWSSGSRLITPGWYYIHVNCSVNQSFLRCVKQAAAALIGIPDPNAQVGALWADRTQGTLATTAPTGMGTRNIDGTGSNNNAPAFGFRRAA